MSQELRDLVAKDHITAVIVRLFTATDRGDWAAVRDCFQPSVRFDMTSLAGGEPATLTPAEIAGAWEGGLRPLEAVHHQAGNFVVVPDGQRAKASCYGIAYHYRRTRSGRDTRTFVGSYDFELQEDAAGIWRIGLFRFQVKFIEGNRTLETDPAP